MDEELNTEGKTVYIDLNDKRVGIKIDPNATYTTDQLAIAFGVPEYAFRERVRDGRLVGKKIGQFFFCQGVKVIEFLEAGFSFKQRPGTRSAKSIEDDIQKSREREEKRLSKTAKTE